MSPAWEQSTVFTDAPVGLVYAGDKGCSSGGVNSDYEGVVQPRVGLAYQLSKSGSDAIHVGYGIYTIQVPLSSLQGFDQMPWARHYQIGNPFQNVSNIWASNGTTNPFESGFYGWGYVAPSNTVFPVNPGVGVSTYASNFRPGYVQQYSLSYQRGFGSNDSVETAYVGTKGTRLAQNYDLNQPVYIPGTSTGLGAKMSASLP